MKEQLNELALFAGAGGGILGGKLLGWRTICAVEWDGYARDVLVARQNDGCLEAFPIWDDVQTFDGKPWRGCVDVVSGGFPCQDISAAGKGAGIEGERSGMWKHMARIIGEVLPQFVFVENSPMLVGRGLAVVLSDLAEMGYDARWGIVGAHHAGAPHKRDRIWIVAHSNGGDAECGQSQRSRIWAKEAGQGSNDNAGRSSERLPDVADSKGGKNHGRKRGNLDGAPHGGEGSHAAAVSCSEDVADTSSERQPRQRQSINTGNKAQSGERQAGDVIDVCIGREWPPEPDVGRVANGVAARVDRLRCLGNGQVPAVAQLAWETLKL